MNATEHQLLELIRKGEGLDLEFKTCREQLNRDVWAEIMDFLEFKNRMHFASNYLQPALDAGFIAMTIPDKSRSSRQNYRLIGQGKRIPEKIS